jgi:hypothetical protein
VPPRRRVRFRRPDALGSGRRLRRDRNALGRSRARCVDRLPAPALAIIDKSEGRFLAGVILEHSLTEAGARITPELEKYV